jgi:hypothetical protein
VNERVQAQVNGSGFVVDLGAAVHIANAVIGDRLGLYRALAAGPCTAAELAAHTGVEERHVAEWLAGQAAGGDVTRDGSRFGLDAASTSLPLVLAA